MKLKEKKKKASKKEIEEIRKIYWQIKNDPEAMRQARRLIEEVQK